MGVAQPVEQVGTDEPTAPRPSHGGSTSSKWASSECTLDVMAGLQQRYQVGNSCAAGDNSALPRSAWCPATRYPATAEWRCRDLISAAPNPTKGDANVGDLCG